MQPRERYLRGGPTPAGDAELLALILGTGVAGQSAMGLAVDVLQRFGGLRGVANAGVHELRGVRGLGPARAVRVHAALQAGRRSLRPTDRGEAIQSPANAHRLLGPALRASFDEELHGLFLDRRRRLVCHRVLTRGSDAYTVVDPRQVFRVAVQCAASAVVLGHNHPSGDPSPSSQDREVTHRVATAGRMLGVPLLDHLVIGDDRFVSLAEEGLIPAWRNDAICWTA